MQPHAYLRNRPLGEAGLPVPELVAWHPSVGPEERPCAIWEYIDGDQANWLKLKACPYDEAHCGELLRRIHALDYEGSFCFPGDEGCNPHLGPCVDSWSDMFPVAKAARSYFDQGRLNRRQADLLVSLPEQLASELGRVEKRLLHMDFLYNGNLILERGGKRIISIVDGAESMSGDPRLELAYFDFGYPGSGWTFDMERFRAGYGTEHDPQDPLGRFYQLNYYLFERFDYYYVNGDRGERYQEEIKALLDTFA